MAVPNKGYEKFKANVLNINSILNKIKDVVYTEQYEKELAQIIEEAKLIESSNEVMTVDLMKNAYEEYSFDPFINRLNKLTQNMEMDVLPLYKMHLLTKKINIKSIELNNDNIEELINDAKELIKILNNNNSYKHKDYDSIVSNAYKCVYNVLLYESIYQKNTLLNYISQSGTELNREYLSQLINDDATTLLNDSVVNSELEYLKKEGLGFDLLHQNIINQIAILKMPEEEQKYNDERYSAKTALFEHMNYVKQVTKEKLDAHDDLKTSIKKLKINKRKLKAVLLSYVLVPLAVTVGANFLAEKIVPEYEDVTKTTNLITNKVISKEVKESNERLSSNKLKVRIIEPNTEISDGIKGHKETVYEYSIDNNGEFGPLSEKDELVKNSEINKEANQAKEIYVTERYQNKANGPDLKLRVIASLGGVSIGIMINSIISLARRRNLKDVYNEIRGSSAEMNSYIERQKVLEKELFDFNDDIELLKEEYSDLSSKYGEIDEKVEIPTPITKKRLLKK